MNHQLRAARVAAAVALLVALVVVGCGRRGIVADDAAADGAATSAVPTSGRVGPITSPESTETAPADASPASGGGATVSPAPGTPSPAPTIAPFEAPDLTAIQRLLDEIDAALGADATADSDEGSAP